MGTKSGAFLVCGRFGLANRASSAAPDQHEILPYGEFVVPHQRKWDSLRPKVKQLSYTFEHSVHPKQGVDWRRQRGPSQPAFGWLGCWSRQATPRTGNAKPDSPTSGSSGSWLTPRDCWYPVIGRWPRHSRDAIDTGLESWRDRVGIVFLSPPQSR